MEKNIRQLSTAIIIFILIGGAILILPKEEELTPIRVGVIDSGFPHPSYIPFPGYDVDDYIGEIKSFVPNEDGYDYFGHGRKVISTIINSATAPLKIYSAKIIDRGGTGKMDALDDVEAWLITMNVDIVVLAIGTPDRQYYHHFIEFAKHSIPLVMSAGNSGSTTYRHATTMYPANLPYNNIITVGAVNSDGEKEVYSSTGRNSIGLYTIDVVDIGMALTFDNKPTDALGTSYAAPRVAGKIIDLIYYATNNNYTLSASDIKTLTLNTGNEFDIEIGYGQAYIEKMIANLDKTIFLISVPNNTYSYFEYMPEFYNASIHRNYNMLTYNVHMMYSDNPHVDFTINSTHSMVSYKGNATSTSYTFDIHYNSRYVLLYGDQQIQPHSPTIKNITDYIEFIPINDNNNHTILIDYSGQADRHYHEYGVQTPTIFMLKQAGYNVTISGGDISKLNLTQFDMVYSPNFEDKWYLGFEDIPDYKYLVEQHYSSAESFYNMMNYTKAGGTWIISASPFTGLIHDYFVRQNSLYSLLNFTLSISNTLAPKSIGSDIFGNYSISFSFTNVNTFRIHSTYDSMFLADTIPTGTIGPFGDGKLMVIGDTSPFIYFIDPLLLLDLYEWSLSV